jgi:hypothetical protein
MKLRQNKVRLTILLLTVTVLLPVRVRCSHLKAISLHPSESLVYEAEITVEPNVLLHILLS